MTHESKVQGGCHSGTVRRYIRNVRSTMWLRCSPAGGFLARAVSAARLACRLDPWQALTVRTSLAEDGPGGHTFAYGWGRVWGSSSQ